MSMLNNYTDLKLGEQTKELAAKVSKPKIISNIIRY